MEENNNNNQGITFNQLLENTKKFEEIVSFPTQHNKIDKVAQNEEDQKNIAKFAFETRAITHNKLKTLINDFLNFKRE